MKKIFFTILVLLYVCPFCQAVNFGTYKTETEYGLIDGFKWNFFNREGRPLVELKSETPEEIKRKELEKKMPKKEEIDEAQMYRFMLDDVSVF